MAAPASAPQQNPFSATHAVAITPSDGSDLAVECRAVYVGGAGNMNVDLPDGGTVLFSGLTAGSILPVRVRRVRSTSTTASNLVALY